MREIYRPKSLSEAMSLRKEVKKSAYISGGVEVMRLGSSIEEDMLLIDIKSLLGGEIRKEDNKLYIGAGASFEDIISSDLVPKALKKSALFMANLPLRNQATIAGNVVLKRDDSYLLPALLAFDAEVKVFTPDGERRIMPLTHLLESDGCCCIILGFYIDPSLKVAVRRRSISSTTHAAVTMAYSKIGFGAAIKGSGIFTSPCFEEISFTDDITGSAEYKRFISQETLEELKEEVNG